MDLKNLISRIEIAESLGITRRLRFHDLRHTFGSDLATAEVPLTYIGKVMGHANPATTRLFCCPPCLLVDAPLSKAVHSLGRLVV